MVADSGQGSGLADKRDEQPKSPIQVIPAQLFGYLQALWIPSNFWCHWKEPNIASC
jgi:hypothetical protein